MDAVIARYLPDFTNLLPAQSEPIELRADPIPPNPWIRARRTGARTGAAAPSAAPPEDREALLREAEERGRRFGRSEAQAEGEAALERERAEFAERFAAARLSWTETEAEALASGFSAALRALDTGLTDRIARLLVPVLTDALRRQAVGELGDALSRLLADPQHAVVRVTGPGDLLAALAARLGPLGASVAFTPGETPEVHVSADETRIETQITAWTRLLAAAVEDDRA